MRTCHRMLAEDTGQPVEKVSKDTDRDSSDRGRGGGLRVIDEVITARAIRRPRGMASPEPADSGHTSDRPNRANGQAREQTWRVR